MVTVTRLILSVFAGALIVAVGATVAAACSCVEMATAEHIENADVVARVIVERIELPDEEGRNAGDPAIYTVRPTRVWKGDVVDTFSVETAPDGAACGLEGFSEGSDIVLFAIEHGGGLTANLCGGTAVAGSGLLAEVGDILGEGKPMDVPPPTNNATTCTCEEMTTAEHAVEADLVARVVVELVNMPVEGAPDDQPASYTLRPTRVWKSDVISQFKVTSEPSGAACGLEGISKGQDLVVFANETGDGWSANLCGGTAPASETLVAELLEVVGPGVAPDTDPAGRPGQWVWPTIAAVASVLLLGYVVVRWWVRPREKI